MCIKLEMRIDELEEEKQILNKMLDNSMSIESVQKMAHSLMTMFAPTVTQEYANKFIEEWRKKQ
mgnify:CR=1 FL=1